MLKWDHWHIEPSSICTLKCPRCPRAELPDSLLNRQLNLEFFQNQIGIDIIKQIRRITFCGNDGDPIYCRDIIDIIAWIKQHNSNIHIVLITNGSHKKSLWWRELAAVLDHQDELHFSIDGLAHNNHRYRINCDWSSLVQAITTFRQYNQHTYMIWAAIAFRFNQQDIDSMQHQAETWKFDGFQLTKSTKFGSKYPQAYGVEDQLEPTDLRLIASGQRFEREFMPITDRLRPGQHLEQMYWQRAQTLKNYSSLCMIGNKGVFLNSGGEFYPCCWTANRYPHNNSWQNRFNLHSRTFEDIIQDPFWTTDFLKFDNLECQTKCTKQLLSNFEHVTQW